MSDDDGGGLNATVEDRAVDEMVETLRPGWTVSNVERAAEGTDFVATLTVATGTSQPRVVLKATTAGLVDREQARVEPRVLELVGRETSIPVPEVFGYCDDHDDLPAPFFLMECVDGENFEGRRGDLSDEARERVCRAAGRNLADLHELGPLPAAGAIGVRDDDLAVVDTDDHPRYDDSRQMVLDGADDTLDELLEGDSSPN